MIVIIEMIEKIKNAAMTVSSYLIKSDIALLFLRSMAVVLLLNCVKAVILYGQLRTLKKNKQCEFLKQLPGGQKCSNTSYKDLFAENHNSCKNCTGKSISLNKDDLERYAINSGIFNKVIILLAKFGNSLLPYMSILFTLITAAFFAQGNGN